MLTAREKEYYERRISDLEKQLECDNDKYERQLKQTKEELDKKTQAIATMKVKLQDRNAGAVSAAENQKSVAEARAKQMEINKLEKDKEEINEKLKKAEDDLALSRKEVGKLVKEMENMKLLNLNKGNNPVEVPEKNCMTKIASQVTSERYESIKIKTKFVESCVIDPKFVTTVDIVNSEEWIIDMKVEFVLSESCKWYSGSLKWTGLINKMMSAVVYVNVAEPNDYIRNYLCNKELCDRMQTSYNDNMVIVLLSAVTKCHLVKEDLYLRRIFEYVRDKEVGVDILVDIINNEDSSALKYVVKQWKYPINLERYPELLPKLISQDNYDVIALLLKSFVISKSDNIHLLNIAQHFLMRGNNDIFILACKMFQDANVTMENGETFLTSIMKDIDDENIINRVIETNIFDINKTNNDGHSPLVLACRRLMVSTVRLLVNSGASVSYNNNMAFDTVMDQQKNTSDTAKLRQAIEIFGIIGRGLQSNICKNCMDRKVNTSMNCGHTLCDICANNMESCAHCDTRITERRRIILS